MGLAHTHGNFLKKKTNETIFQGAGPVDGTRETMCSFRAEATHLVAMVSILNRIQKFVKRKKPYITLHTDSKSVIEALKGPKRASTKHLLKDHHDIITQLNHLLKNTAFKIEILYVKAHQDPKKELPPEAERNIRVNDLAFDYYEREDAIFPSQDPIFFPAQRLCIINKGGPLVAGVIKQIKYNEQKSEIENFFETKFAIHPKMQKQVHWKVIGRTFKNNPTKQNMFTKIFHKQTHTFKKSHEWGTAKSPLCQLCRIQDEDNDHLLECQNIDMTRIRETHIKKILLKLKIIKTHPTIIQAISEGMKRWNKNVSSMKLNQCDDGDEVNKIVYSQSCIGWDNFQ